MQRVISRNSFVKACILVGALTGSYFPASAFAADASPIFVPSGMVQVIGSVSFQKHQTVVNLEECEDKLCPESKPYWVMMVDTGEFNFELGQIFSFGSETAPSSVDVSQVTVRPGERILLEAKLDSLNRNYGILSEVNRIEILMDEQKAESKAEGPGIITVGKPSVLPSDALSWHCYGVLPTGQKVYTEVWFSGNDGNQRIFHLVSFLENTGKVGIDNEFLRLDHAIELRLGDSFAYRGDDGGIEARLTVTRKPFFVSSEEKGEAHAEGVLELRRLSPNFDEQIFSKLPMSCMTDQN